MRRALGVLVMVLLEVGLGLWLWQLDLPWPVVAFGLLTPLMPPLVREARDRHGQT